MHKKIFYKLIPFIVIFFIMLSPIGIFGTNEDNTQGEILVVFKTNINRKKASDIADKKEDSLVELIKTNQNNIAVISTDSKNLNREIKQYNEYENVLHAQKNYTYSLAKQNEDKKTYSLVNDYYINNYDNKKWQNHLYYTKVSNINGNRPSCWDYASGKNVKVGVLDTGINPNSREYQENVKNSYDAVNDKSPLNNDIDSHGTHVSAIVAAKGNNDYLGAGVAYNCDLYPVNVFRQNEKGDFIAYTSDIIKGFNYLLEHDVKIINMSFGEYLKNAKDDLLFMDMINNAYETRDVLSICAAGNGNGSTKGYTKFYFPADTKNAISVTALSFTPNKNNKTSYSKVNITPWSNYNEHKDISAPGSNIYSLGVKKDNNGNIDETLISKSGTSMAAPFVSGVIALIKEINPTLPASEIKNILYSTCVDLGKKGRDDYYGNGMINPLKAVKKALWKNSSLTLDKYESNTWDREVKITADMKIPTYMKFEVYNSNGEYINTIYSENEYKRHNHSSSWDYKDKYGNTVTDGKYIIKAVLPFVDKQDNYTENKQITIHSNVNLNLSEKTLDVTKRRNIVIGLNVNNDSFLNDIKIKDAKGNLIKTIPINKDSYSGDLKKIIWDLSDNEGNIINKNGIYNIYLSSTFNGNEYITHNKVKICGIGDLSLKAKNVDKSEFINYKKSISLSAALNKNAQTKVYITDQNNKNVKTLINKKTKNIDIKWDLKNSNKKYVKKGNYIINIRSNDGFNTVKKSYNLQLKNPKKIRVTKKQLKNNKLTFKLNTIGKVNIIVKNDKKKTIQKINKIAKKGKNIFKIKKSAKYITIKADNISSTHSISIK